MFLSSIRKISDMKFNVKEIQIVGIILMLLYHSLANDIESISGKVTMVLCKMDFETSKRYSVQKKISP